MGSSRMTSSEDFAAVVAIGRVRSLVAVARHLLGTPQVLLLADGDTAFARCCG